jgi:hypothetical protein
MKSDLCVICVTVTVFRARLIRVLGLPLLKHSAIGRTKYLDGSKSIPKRAASGSAPREPF